MPTTLVTVAFYRTRITVTTMGGRELVRTSDDLRGNQLVGRIHCALGVGSANIRMVTPCAHTVRGNGQRVRTQFKRWRWHPTVFRVDPGQRLINVHARQRADPVWKTRFARDPPYDSYTFVTPDGRIFFGALRGGLQKIPFDLGEEMMQAAAVATRAHRYTPQDHFRFLEAAWRVREWRP